MGISEWSYHNDYNPAARQKMVHVDLTQRFEQLNIEVELGFDADADRARSAAMPQLRHANSLHSAQSASSAMPASTSARCNASPSRVTAMNWICGPGFRLRRTISNQDCYVSDPLPQTRESW